MLKYEWEDLFNFSSFKMENKMSRFNNQVQCIEIKICQRLPNVITTKIGSKTEEMGGMQFKIASINNWGWKQKRGEIELEILEELQVTVTEDRSWWGDGNVLSKSTNRGWNCSDVQQMRKKKKKGRKRESRNEKGNEKRKEEKEEWEIKRIRR